MDENLWKRLIDWNRSPIYRVYKYFKIEKVIRQLYDKNPDLQREVDASAVPALIWALEGKDSNVRWSG